MSSSTNHICPLCHSDEVSTYDRGPLHRRFYKCDRCFLLFTHEENQPERQEEKARYLTHNNSPQNDGYVKFLRRAVEPATKYLQPGMTGLDYGCGPGPAIPTMLNEQGIECKNYDPLFFPKWQEGPFDFVFCTETFEHFFHPAKELKRLKSLLKPAGYLVIMTVLWNEDVDLEEWFYARDITHVCFYHQKTLDAITEKFGFAECYNDGERVFIFQVLED